MEGEAMAEWEPASTEWAKAGSLASMEWEAMAAWEPASMEWALAGMGPAGMAPLVWDQASMDWAAEAAALADLAAGKPVSPGQPGD